MRWAAEAFSEKVHGLTLSLISKSGIDCSQGISLFSWIRPGIIIMFKGHPPTILFLTVFCFSDSIMFLKNIHAVWIGITVPHSPSFTYFVPSSSQWQSWCIAIPWYFRWVTGESHSLLMEKERKKVGSPNQSYPESYGIIKTRHGNKEHET